MAGKHEACPYVGARCSGAGPGGQHLEIAIFPGSERQ
jgi:hypothetical protein